MAITQARHWRTAAQALALVRRRQGVTRTELASLLGLQSGPTSDLVKRLVQADLVHEQPVTREGPGRPTTVLHASPSGPLAIVLDLRHGDWRLGTCDLDGSVTILRAGQHDGSAPDVLLAQLASEVRTLAQAFGDRVVGAGVTVPGLAVDGRLAITMLGWPEIDTAPLRFALDAPVLLGNDATMAGVAEARLHPVEQNPLLHIVVEVGIGGALIVDGQPTLSARGMHGEFGHLPLGDRHLSCPCGAQGCWNTSFDPVEIARRAGLKETTDPRSWLHDLYKNPNQSQRVREVVTSVVADLASGIAGLVNTFDPAVVSLGGMAHLIRRAEPEVFRRTYSEGLMRVHRANPPDIIEARAGDDATLIGAGLSVFDNVLDADLLAHWASSGSRAA